MCRVFCLICILLQSWVYATAQEAADTAVVLEPTDTTVVDEQPRKLGYVRRPVREFDRLNTDYIEPQHYIFTVMLQGTYAYDHYSVSSAGGNRQKVNLGRWMIQDKEILILDCPTRGVDIGVKAAMYQLINQMKKAGKSIVMISEELPELIGMTDRLLILKNGELTGEYLRKDRIDGNMLVDAMI